MTRNTWIIFAVICAALIGGLIWTSQGDKTNVDDVDVFAVQAANDDNGNIADHTFGNPDAKVIVVEYFDYNCPGCKVADPAVKEAVESYKDDVLLVLRNFPIAQIHPNSRAAAAAAEAAGLQGKYLQMHGKLYQTSGDWQSLTIEKRTQYFDQYASEIGLDVDKFKTDMTSANVEAKINYDVALAKKIGITGTPSIYVNGKSANVKVDKDGKIVSDTSSDGDYAWSSAERFKHMLIPALKEAGLDVKE